MMALTDFYIVCGHILKLQEQEQSVSWADGSGQSFKNSLLAGSYLQSISILGVPNPSYT